LGGKFGLEQVFDEGLRNGDKVLVLNDMDEKKFGSLLDKYGYRETYRLEYPFYKGDPRYVKEMNSALLLPDTLIVYEKDYRITHSQELIGITSEIRDLADQQREQLRSPQGAKQDMRILIQMERLKIRLLKHLGIIHESRPVLSFLNGRDPFILKKL